MITYQQIKDWFEIKENKQKLVIGVCYVLVFFVGFGAGSFKKGIRRDSFKPQTNYTTPAAKKPAAAAIKEAELPAAVPIAASASTTAATANCVVKGNISSAGKKIFHVKGGSFYARVKPEQCFNTEAEALAAGFIKSSR